MNKLIYQTDQEDLVALAGGQMFTFYDENIKSAASDLFSKEKLAEYAPDKDHFMLHVVAMGDHETYGSNKNADSFTKEALEKYHHTFVKNGCFFREHRNRCQKTQGIGFVKASAFNDRMRRVELIVHGDKRKAEEEYEMAKSGKELSFSMSCKIASDVANCCGKVSTSPKHYCSHMKNSALQYIPEFKKYAFVFNPHPTFFDISRVGKPADRIAHYLEYAFPEEDGVKRASFNDVITGTQWAEFEGLELPGDPTSWAPEQMALLEKLAGYEALVRDVITRQPRTSDAKVAFIRDVVPRASVEELVDSEIELLRTLQVGTMCREFAKRASILPFYSFMAYATGRTLQDVKDDPVTKRACSMLPEIFKKLMTSGCGCELGNMFDSSSHNACEYDSANSDEVQKFMDMAEKKFSIKTEPVRNRIMTITIIKGANYTYKPAAVVQLTDNFEKRALALAETYGLYKISALLDIAKMHGDEIDEPQYLIAVGQNIEL